jgi:hypothetical protein
VTSPVLAREDADGHRWYTHPVTGLEVPSVTTIIGVIAKPALVGWSAKMAAQYAVSHWRELGEVPALRRVEEIRHAHTRMAGEAADTGDAIHEVIDAWAKGNPHPSPPKGVTGYVNSFISFMADKRPEFIENEVTVWSDKHGYAGTADWIARIGGTVMLGDNKTGRRVYEEAALQVSALASADYILREDGTQVKTPLVTGMAVLHIRPRGWKLIPVMRREENFRAFLAAKEIWEWQQCTAPGALGDPL